MVKVLRPAANFTHEMSRDGPAIADLYPRLLQILADRTPLDTELGQELRAALFLDLETTFPIESIPDEILIATYLHPSNLQVSELFDTRGDLRVRAEGLILARQRTLLDQGFKLYENLPANVTNFDRTLKRDLEDYWENARSVEYRVVDRKKPHDWWRSHRRTFVLLPVFAQMYLSVQASSAPVERFFSLVGLIFTKTRANLSGPTLEKMALMKAWDKTTKRKVDEEEEE